jgi:hypothetical protein
LIKILPTPDIRDKEDDGQLLKEGIFDRRGVTKPARADYLTGLLTEIRNFFDAGGVVQRNGLLCVVALKIVSYFS